MTLLLALIAVASVLAGAGYYAYGILGAESIVGLILLVILAVWIVQTA